jgi:hypothetical protein
MKTKQPEQANQNGGSRSDAVSGYLKEAGDRELTISIDRASRSYAIFDQFELLKPFQQYEIEATALREGRAWVAERSSVEPQIVYPRITRASFR